MSGIKTAFKYGFIASAAAIGTVFLRQKPLRQMQKTLMVLQEVTAIKSPSLDNSEQNFPLLIFFATRLARPALPIGSNKPMSISMPH